MAVSLRASFAGVVFAGGPRLVDARAARSVLAPLDGTPVRRVGVFGRQGADEILRMADETSLHVIQLHDGATLDLVRTLRERFGGSVWGVVGIAGDTIPADLAEVADRVDAIVLDSAVGGRAGGTGVAFDWAGVAPALDRVRSRTRFVLAGGLRASNAARAVQTLRPDVVDVSSGVESALGIKDPELMRAFAASVASATAARSREER